MATTAFEYFVGRRNQACVRMLERNESVASFMQGVLEHLTTFCEAEGIAYENIVLDRPYIGHNRKLEAHIQWTR